MHANFGHNRCLPAPKSCNGLLSCQCPCHALTLSYQHNLNAFDHANTLLTQHMIYSTRIFAFDKVIYADPLPRHAYVELLVLDPYKLPCLMKLDVLVEDISHMILFGFRTRIISCLLSLSSTNSKEFTFNVHALLFFSISNMGVLHKNKNKLHNLRLPRAWHNPHLA